VWKNSTKVVLDWRLIQQYHWLVLHNKQVCPPHQHEMQQILHLHPNCKSQNLHADHTASPNFENSCICGICGGGRSFSLFNDGKPENPFFIHKLP